MHQNMFDPQGPGLKGGHYFLNAVRPSVVQKTKKTRYNPIIKPHYAKFYMGPCGSLCVLFRKHFKIPSEQIY